MSEVNELFGEGGDAPTPRVALVLALAVGGLALALFGLACSVLPGVALVMLAWLTVEKEMDRVETGFLPETARTEVATLRTAVRLGVVMGVVLVIAQTWLYGAGLYDWMLQQALMWMGAQPPA